MVCYKESDMRYLDSILNHNLFCDYLLAIACDDYFLRSIIRHIFAECHADFAKIIQVLKPKTKNRKRILYYNHYLYILWAYKWYVAYIMLVLRITSNQVSLYLYLVLLHTTNIWVLYSGHTMICNKLVSLVSLAVCTYTTRHHIQLLFYWMSNSVHTDIQT